MGAHRVCPWRLGYLLASPVRKLLQDPHRILLPYVRAGMTVLEPGPGWGSSLWSSRVLLARQVKSWSWMCSRR